MKYSLKNIRPDSFSGLIFGLEGLNGGRVILNGPTGCKFYHSAMVDGQTMKSLSFDPLEYPEKFYFGQGRVPCTYLDSHDYVFGAGDKIELLLNDVKKRKSDFIALINSPGAALIGDDLNDLLRKVEPAPVCFSIDNPGYSESYGDGLQRGLIELISNLDINDTKTEDDTVNLLGFNIYQKYYKGNLNELKRLLKLCNIKTNCCFVDEDIENIKNLKKAKYNIVVYPEYGLKLAEFLEENYEMPYIVMESGVPIGFDATESFFTELTSYIGNYSEEFDGDIKTSRVKSYIFLSRYTSILGIPKGATYAILAETSVALPLHGFLTNYLGMIPNGIQIIEDIYPEYLDELKSRETENKHFLIDNIEDVPYQVLLGDGNSIASSVGKDDYIFGVEILEPSMGYLDVVEKTILGTNGALFLLEQILNGLKFS